MVTFIWIIEFRMVPPMNKTTDWSIVLNPARALLIQCGMDGI